MAVAKSYQNLEIVKEPYEVNGRLYVQVKMANGNTKQVRWYSDKEYAKYYGEQPDHSSDPYFKTQKEILGFSKGYITIFKGDTYAAKEWFKEHGARYTRFWGWYIISEMEVPAELPDGLEAIKLDWELVGNGDSLKPDAQVQQAVDALICDPSTSEYIGEVGQRIEVQLTVKKAINLDGYYGASTMHIMEDENGNVFVWTTSAKSWEEGSSRLVRGTIKEHRVYKNVKQTVLTRCAEVQSK